MYEEITGGDGVVREPNSVHFWRSNSIAGLKMMLADVEYPFPDPEAKEKYDTYSAELKSLLAQEATVKARYYRIMESRITALFEDI